MAEIIDHEAFSTDTESLLARIALQEELTAFYKKIVDGYSPAFEAQERVIKYLLVQPNMLVENSRAFEVLRFGVPVAARDWQATQKNLGYHHGIMRTHKKSKYSPFAGVVSLDAEKLTLLEDRYAFLTPSVRRLILSAGEEAIKTGQIDTELPEIGKRYPWVSPVQLVEQEPGRLKYGMTTASLQHLGLIATHASQ